MGRRLLTYGKSLYARNSVKHYVESQLVVDFRIREYVDFAHFRIHISIWSHHPE